MVTIRKFKYMNGNIRNANIIRIIKFLNIKLYLPLSNDAILCQWHYYILNLKFLAPPQLLPPHPQLTKIWEVPTSSNYTNRQLLIST